MYTEGESVLLDELHNNLSRGDFFHNNIVNIGVSVLNAAVLTVNSRRLRLKLL